MKRGYISTSDFNDIKKGLSSYDLPTKLADSKISSHTILETTRSDKKMSSAGIKFVLLNTIGDAYIDDSVSDEEMIEAIEVLING
jgi:3-dehydroquinate synthase